MNRPGFLIPVLALASLFLGWRTYDAWTGPIKLKAAAIPSGPAAVPIGVSPEEAPPPADFPALSASISSRPVFRPDRRPFREETAQIPKRNYEAEISRFTLSGVLLMGNDKKGVVTGKGPSGREERWEVGQGDSLPGFTVKDIAQDGITLSADGSDFLLPLYAGGPKGQGPMRTEVGPRGPTASTPSPPAGRKPGGAPAAAPSARPAPASPSTPVAAAPPTPTSAPNYPPRFRGRVRNPALPRQMEK